MHLKDISHELHLGPFLQKKLEGTSGNTDNTTEGNVVSVVDVVE